MTWLRIKDTIKGRLSETAQAFLTKMPAWVLGGEKHQKTSNTSFTQSLKIKYEWFSRLLSVSCRSISNSASKGINVASLASLPTHHIKKTLPDIYISIPLIFNVAFQYINLIYFKDNILGEMH